MKTKRIRSLAALGVLWTVSGSAAAIPISDPVGDFLPTYLASGRPSGPDLEVVAAAVAYHPGSHQFQFIGTMAGAIGTTVAAAGAGPLHVRGVDRGLGSERFLAGSPSVGDAVAFDSVVILRPDGTATVNPFGLGGAINLPAGTALVGGNSISAFLDETLFPTQGREFSAYTGNLWPRFGAGLNAQISDFAPDAAGGALDAADAAVTLPAPSTPALLGIGALTLARRRRAL